MVSAQAMHVRLRTRPIEKNQRECAAGQRTANLIFSYSVWQAYQAGGACQSEYCNRSELRTTGVRNVQTLAALGRPDGERCPAEDLLLGLFRKRQSAEA